MPFTQNRRLRATVIFGAFLTLAACTDESSANGPRLPALPTPEQDTCRALTYADLIGQPVAKFQELPVPADTAQRILRPNQPVTMDFLAQRLNIELDAKDQIVRLSCG